MKKMIMHLLTSNIYSGAENVAITIIEELNKKYNFIYVCQKGPVEKILNEKKIPYISLKKINYFSIKKIIKKYKPDLIHAHGFTTSVICFMLGNKIKYISHLHNNKRWIKNINAKSILYLMSAKKAKKILVVSKAINDEYIFSKKIKNKIIEIGNPVFFEKIRKKIKNSDCTKKYDICCVARLTSQKNPTKFINVINKLRKIIPNIKAIWVGDGELKNDAIKYTSSLNLQDNIEFIGFKENPYNYMYSSKLFVLTSDWEGYGLVAFEALSLGVPAIVSNVGGLPEIVDNNCGNLCISETDFTNAIVNLLNNPIELNKKSKAAIEKAKELNNIDKYISVLDEVYEDNMN